MKLQLPKHVSFILDGNRRFGELVLNDKMAGHEFGADRIKDVLQWCRDFDIKIITLWVFSTENFNRPKKEFDEMMKLFIRKFKEFKNNKEIHQNKIKVNFYGRLDLFPKDVQKSITELVEATKEYDSYVLNFAAGYGGHQEILDVTKKLAIQVSKGIISPEEISKELFESAMYLDLPDIDLIIRTGGVQRTSGFMPWKGAYAEWYFTEKFWPEFSKHDFVKALTDYSERKRRFGK